MLNTRVATKGLTVTNIVTASGSGLGVRTSRGIVDVAAINRAQQLGLPTTVDDLIHGRGDGEALTRLLAGSPAANFLIPEASARFAPVVTQPEKIICLGLNYRAHAAETGAAAPPAPILFNKFNNSLNGHKGTITVTGHPGKRWDYEAEMVIVMGRDARNVTEANALEYVFGYATGQDFSARDLQNLSSQWMLGKAGDGWAPVGPWVVSADQIDPDNLDIKCFVNGEQRQSSNTRNMIFNTRFIISFISRHLSLKAGDIIFTGTPDGVILGYPPEKQVWLKAGDRIVTSIGKLGDQEVTLV